MRTSIFDAGHGVSYRVIPGDPCPGWLSVHVLESGSYRPMTMGEVLALSGAPRRWLREQWRVDFGLVALAPPPADGRALLPFDDPLRPRMDFSPTERPRVFYDGGRRYRVSAEGVDGSTATRLELSGKRIRVERWTAARGWERVAPSELAGILWRDGVGASWLKRHWFADEWVGDERGGARLPEPE